MADEEYANALNELQRCRNWDAAFALSKKQFELEHQPPALIDMCEALLLKGHHVGIAECLSKLNALWPNLPETSRLRALQAESLGEYQTAIASWRQYFGRETSRSISPAAKALNLEWVPHTRTQAQALADQGRWQEARAAWELLFVKNNDEFRVLFNVCDCYIEQNKYLESYEILSTHVLQMMTAEKRFEPLLRRTITGLAKGTEALSSIVDDSFLRVISDEAALKVSYGVIDSCREDEELLFLCRHLESRASVELMWLVAVRLFEKKRLALASRIVGAALRIAPNHSELMFLSLQLSWKLGAPEGSRLLVQRLQSSPDEIVATADRLSSYLLVHRAVFGLDAFLERLIDSAYSTIFRTRGSLFDIVERLAEERDDDLLNMIQNGADAANEAARDEMRFLDTIFRARNQTNETQIVLEGLQKYHSKRDKADHARMVKIAETLFEQDRLLLLERFLAPAEGLAREDPKLKRIRAQSATKLKQWNQAAASWAEVTAENPNDALAFVNLTLALIEAERPDDARNVFETLSVSSASSSGTIRLWMATCAARLGDFEAAKMFALDAYEKLNANELPVDRRNELARVLSVTGCSEKAWLLYEDKPQIDVPDKSNLAVILDPGLSVRAGHHVNYNLFAWRLIADLAREGAEFSPLILCREDVSSAPGLAGLHISSALHFVPYAFDNFPVTHQSLAGANASFYHDLSLQKLNHRVGLVFMHSMRAVMVDGFSRWVDDVFNESEGLVVIGVIEVDHLVAADRAFFDIADIYRTALARLAGNPNIQLLVYVETEFGKRFIDELGIANLVVEVFPYLAASLCLDYRLERDLEPDDPICLGIVGGTRPQRGSHLFPGLIARTQDLSQTCRWKLQLDTQKLAGLTEQNDWPYIERIRGYANAVVIDSVLSVEEYFTLLSQIDVVILPYQERYAVSGSGVLYESIYMGKYLVVPRHTFMPAVLAELDYPHLVFEESTLDCLELVVRQVVENQENIKRQLASLRRDNAKRLPSARFYQLVKERIAALA